MPDPRLYPRQDRQQLIDRIGRMSNPDAAGAFGRECQQLRQDFHPAFFAELDWQDLRPDTPTSPVHSYIANFSFFFTVELNLQRRLGTARPDEYWLAGWRDRVGALFDRYAADFPLDHGELAELDGLIQEFDSTAASGRPALESPETATIRAALDTVFDPSRLIQLVAIGCVNALYRALDDPATRPAARRYLHSERSATGRVPLLSLATEATSPAALTGYLTEQAAAAESAGLLAWAGFARAVAGLIAGAGLDTRTGYDGQWSEGATPCARCSMWFAFTTMQSMDSATSFVNWQGTGLVYFPVEVTVTSCPFCGYEAPADTPLMFYAPQRQQIVYCAPTKSVLSEDEAVQFWGPAIESIRAEYRDRLDPVEAARFDAASELVCHDPLAFLSAAQLGETIPESHVFNYLVLPDGTGLDLDLSKGFARGVSRTEVAARQAAAEAAGAGAAAAAGQAAPIAGTTFAFQNTLLPGTDLGESADTVLPAMLANLIDYLDQNPSDHGWRPTLSEQSPAHLGPDGKDPT